MKIRSGDELNRYLDKELAWRRREMSILLLAAKSAKGGSSKDALVRAGVCIMYAHFEGFIKKAFTAYLKLVCTRGNSLSLLKDNFIAISHRATIAECGATRKAVVLNKLVTKLVSSGFSEEKLEFRADIVDTKSNLKSEILRDLFALLGIDYGRYATREHLLDEGLLGARNKIAHGEMAIVDIARYEEFHQVVISTLDGIKIDLENAAFQESYRREIPLT